jgi:hypothetical protein
VFCKNCGAQIEDDALFCEKCGTAIKSVSLRKEDEDVSGQQPTESDNIASNVLTGVGHTRHIAEKKKNKKIVLIIIGVVVVLAVAAVAFTQGLLGSVNVDIVAQCNYNSAGKFAYDSTTLYLIGDFNDDDDDTSLYSMSYNGTNKKLISDNGDIIRFRLVDGKILYLMTDYSIGIMDTDGTNDSVLLEIEREDDDVLTTFDLSDGVLYYVYNDELHKHPIQDGEDTVLASNVNMFVLVGKTIYYNTDDSIFSCDINGGNALEIYSGESEMLAYEDNTIYFKNDNGIFSVAVNGEEMAQCIVKADLEHVVSYIVEDDYIYYIQTFTTDEIATIYKSLDLDSTAAFALAMYGCGTVQRVEKTGGIAEEMDSDPAIMAYLYGYPSGMYSRASILIDSFEPVTFE